MCQNVLQIQKIVFSLSKAFNFDSQKIFLRIFKKIGLFFNFRYNPFKEVPKRSFYNFVYTLFVIINLVVEYYKL